MIHSLKINNINNTPFNYIEDNTILVEKGMFEFKKGLNIIIGENGSGKSTLLNMLSHTTFSKKGESELVLDFLSPQSLENYLDLDGNIYDGLEVINNFKYKVFKLIHSNEMDNNDVLNNVDNFGRSYYKSRLSEGENLLYGISMLFENMFKSTIEFNLDELDYKCNDVWKRYQDNIKDFMNKSNIDEDVPIITCLMDEPDRNLDIKNVNMLFNILSNQKPNGQMIVSLHNPLLIYLLIKKCDVNVIELTRNYKNNIINTINDLML